MIKKRAAKIKVEAKALAKIEASARASFQRKKTITEVIPVDVTRAKAGAWLDLISPITEWAGLKGDALRHRRAQLRIQQEDTLAAVAENVRKKIARVSVARPVSAKLLVPILEKASLEDASDEIMIELWSNLLLSAASETSIPPRFVSIVGELNRKEARLFLKIADRNLDQVEFPSMHPDSASYQLQQQFIENALSAESGKKTMTVEGLYDALVPLFDLPGVALCDIIINDTDAESYSIPTADDEGYGHPDLQGDLQILASVGLLHKVDIHREIDRYPIANISMHYFYISELGCDFLGAIRAPHKIG